MGINIIAFEQNEIVLESISTLEQVANEVREEQEKVEKCFYYYVSRIQREHEMRDHGHSRGCSGYRKQGCYQCTGYEPWCDLYLKRSVIE